VLYQEEFPPPQALAQIVVCFQNKFDAIEFLANLFDHYQWESSPPLAITQYFDVLAKL
jgi:hypothetical protein